MSDYISRSKLIKAVENLKDCYNGFSDTYDKACIIGLIDEQPSVERKHGKWFDVTTLDNEFICWVCSECRHGADFVYEPYNFCPNCGAEMESEGRE